MLGNQLSFFVLSELFQMTNSSTPIDLQPSLQKLALHFFNPLLQRDSYTTPAKIIATEGIFCRVVSESLCNKGLKKRRASFCEDGGPRSMPLANIAGVARADNTEKHGRTHFYYNDFLAYF
jgi:hypothetical protein